MQSDAIEQLARRVLAEAPVAIVVLDLDGKIEHVNPFFERLSGFALADIRGQDWFETCLPERDRERVRAVFARSRSGHHVRGHVNPIVTRDGEERLLEWHDDFLHDEAGEVTGILAIGRDVTDRSRAERELEASRVKLAEAQRLSQLGSWELDLSTNALSWSDEIFRIFEIDSARFGASYDAFLAAIHPDDRALVDTTYREAVANRTPYEVVHRLRMLDGRIKWVRERGQTFYDGDRPLRSIGTLQDITDRRRIDERLQEAQALTHVGSWEHDLASHDTWWSDEMFRIFGIAPGSRAPSFEAFVEAIHPDDRAHLLATYERSLAHGEPFDLEHRLRLPDGQVKHVRGQVRYLLDEQGRPRRVEGTMQDISVLAHAGIRLRNILDGLFAFVGLYDLEGTLIEANRAPLEAADVRREDVLGKPFWETYWWSYSSESQEKVRAALCRAAAGEVVRSDFVVRVAEGRFITIDTVFAPLRDASGNIEAIVGSAVDVTERIAAETALRDREARLETVFDHTADAMLLLAVEATGALRVVAVNRPFIDRVSTITPVGEADLLGLTFEALTLEIYERPPEVLAEYLRSLRSVVSSRAPLTFEHSMVFPFGLLHAEVTLAPVIDAAGRCTHVLWSSRDVTASRTAQAALRASLAEKETLLREIHHRVKNNLQVIASLVHFQSKKCKTLEDVAAFGELRRRIQSMSLVHERLYQSPDVSRIDFGEYVRSLVAELSRSFEPRGGIRIDVTSDDVRLPVEQALPSGMIVSELVTNVLKYAFPGGREGTARVTVRSASRRVVLSVDDDGIGFPDGFDPSASRSFGWQLVRMLALQLGGTIQVTSEAGARVRVSFPETPPG